MPAKAKPKGKKPVAPVKPLTREQRQQAKKLKDAEAGKEAEKTKRLAAEEKLNTVLRGLADSTAESLGVAGGGGAGADTGAGVGVGASGEDASGDLSRNPEQAPPSTTTTTTVAEIGTLPPVGGDVVSKVVADTARTYIHGAYVAGVNISGRLLSNIAAPFLAGTSYVANVYRDYRHTVRPKEPVIEFRHPLTYYIYKQGKRKTTRIPLVRGTLYLNATVHDVRATGLSITSVKTLWPRPLWRGAKMAVEIGVAYEMHPTQFGTLDIGPGGFERKVAAGAAISTPLLYMFPYWVAGIASGALDYVPSLKKKVIGWEARNPKPFLAAYRMLKSALGFGLKYVALDKVLYNLFDYTKFWAYIDHVSAMKGAALSGAFYFTSILYVLEFVRWKKSRGNLFGWPSRDFVNIVHWATIALVGIGLTVATTLGAPLVVGGAVLAAVAFSDMDSIEEGIRYGRLLFQGTMTDVSADTLGRTEFNEWAATQPTAANPGSKFQFKAPTSRGFMSDTEMLTFLNFKRNIQNSDSTSIRTMLGIISDVRAMSSYGIGVCMGWLCAWIQRIASGDTIPTTPKEYGADLLGPLSKVAHHTVNMEQYVYDIIKKSINVRVQEELGADAAAIEGAEKEVVEDCMVFVKHVRGFGNAVKKTTNEITEAAAARLWRDVVDVTSADVIPSFMTAYYELVSVALDPCIVYLAMLQEVLEHQCHRTYNMDYEAKQKTVQFILLNNVLNAYVHLHDIVVDIIAIFKNNTGFARSGKKVLATSLKKIDVTCAGASILGFTTTEKNFKGELSSERRGPDKRDKTLIGGKEAYELSFASALFMYRVIFDDAYLSITQRAYRSMLTLIEHMNGLIDARKNIQPGPVLRINEDYYATEIIPHLDKFIRQATTAVVTAKTLKGVNADHNRERRMNERNKFMLSCIDRKYRIQREIGDENQKDAEGERVVQYCDERTKIAYNSSADATIAYMCTHTNANDLEFFVDAVHDVLAPANTAPENLLCIARLPGMLAPDELFEKDLYRTPVLLQIDRTILQLTLLPDPLMEGARLFAYDILSYPLSRKRMVAEIVRSDPVPPAVSRIVVTNEEGEEEELVAEEEQEEEEPDEFPDIVSTV